jgi:hypothetical protein
LQKLTVNVKWLCIPFFNLKYFHIMNLNLTTALKTNRRVFMLQSALTTAAVVAAASAQAQAMVSDTDPQATALGYHSDGTKVEKAKFPKYAAGQNCASCALFQGAAGAAAGGCPLFAGKQVSSKGWCSAYAKKSS